MVRKGLIVTDISLSQVSTDTLIEELEGRLKSAVIAGGDPMDRWSAPSKFEVYHAVATLLATPRLQSNGGWPAVTQELVAQIRGAAMLLRDSVLEPDPDGASVLRMHFEVRSEGYYAVQPTMVPHEIVTKDDIESTLHAIGSLGSAIDRISSSLKSSLRYSIGDIVPTERGQDILSKRDGGK